MYGWRVINLNKVRYMYRKYLTEYDLDTKLFDLWGIDVDDLYPLRKVFIIRSGKDKYILKNIDYDKKRYSFINNSIDYVRRNYSFLMSNKKSVSGRTVEEYNGKYYVLVNLIEGRECSVENPMDLMIASKGLAQFHKAGAGIEYVSDKSDVDYKNIAHKFTERINMLTSIKNMVDIYKFKNYFDEKFCDNVDSCIQTMKRCIECITRIDMDKINNNRDSIVFCHNDLAYHNILIKDEKAYFIDFDYSNINYRVNDIAQFINKSIKNSDYDIKMYKTIIDNYEEISPLLDEEKHLLKVLLSYPNDIIELIFNYYYKKKDWSEEAFNSVMNLKLSQENSRKEFIDKLL